MVDVAIKVENLSKRYRIGLAEESPDTFGGAVARFLTAPVRNLRRLRRLSRFDDDGAEDVIWALRGVSFDVKRGEVLGIIGRNGAGKSTLLKVMSRITRPTEGRIEMRGRVGALLEVGTGFHPELTGRDNIYLNGAVLGMRRGEIDAKFDEIVDFSGVEKFIDTPVKRYSSGMQVRLAFAVAAHLETEVLLVDEVLAVGDYEFQKKCLGKMGDLTEEGRTVLLVSHNLSSILNLCPRVILLDGGQIAKDDTAEAVVEEYLDIGRDRGGALTWPEPDNAPGNKTVRFHSVRVLSEEGHPTNELDIAREIIIQFSYWCLEEGAKLRSSVVLKDRMGVPFLVSVNAPSATLAPDTWFRRPHPVGLYQAECRLPANFLNDGTYSVSPAVTNGDHHDDVVAEDAVSFHVYDSGAMRKEYTGGWLGVVRPRLAWNTKQIGEGSDL